MNSQVMVDRGLLQELISGAGMYEYCTDSVIDEAMRLLATPATIPDADHVEDVRAMVVPGVSAMARILADRNADACNVNREDNWAVYGQDYIDDVTAMLAAAPAAPAADGWIPVSERLPEVEIRLDQECRAGTLSIAPLNVSAAVLVFDGEKVRSTRLEWFDGCLPLPYCITHWMPLPAGPVAHRATGVV